MAANVHIINKQVFEFDCLHKEHAFQIQNKTDHLFVEKISSSIERICDQLSVHDENIQIPLLELDIGKISFDHFDESLIHAFEKAFFEKLHEWKIKNSVARKAPVSREENVFKILKAYLINGRFPWLAGKPDKNHIVELYAEIFSGSPELLKRFILLNFRDEKFIERLIRDIDQPMADHIISLLEIDAFVVSEIENEILQLLKEMLSLDPVQIRRGTDAGENLAEIEKAIGQFSRQIVLVKRILEERNNISKNHLHKIAIELVLKMVSGKNEFLNTEDLITFFGKIIADKFDINDFIVKLSLPQIKQQQIALFDSIMHETEKLKDKEILFAKESVTDEEADDSMKFYISNAGLVLVGNYLTAFFNELQLIEDGRFISSHHQTKAIFILHYLCTGEESSPEYTLPLNKILCGMPLDEPLPSSVLLDEKEKNECIALLEEMINNWQKLGSASVDGLRESFLNRDGILLLEDNGWKLMIERKGYDVLLDSIPWSYKHIKLNWMDTLITTEW